MNLYDLFKQTAARYPEKPAVMEGAKTVSYGALDALIAKTAEDLQSKGVVPGQMIGLCFFNSIACIALTYALWKLDAAVVPIDVEFKQDEIRQVCEKIPVAGLIHYKAADSSWTAGACPVADRSYYFCAMNPPLFPETGIHIAFVRFTSGTTGERKGVVLSHDRIYERIRSVNRILQIAPDDNVLWILPMSHHFVSTIVLYLTQGAGIVLAGGIWSRSILETIRREHVTLLYASPFHYSLLASDSSGQMMPSVRLAVSTTIGLPEDIHERFFRRFRLPLSQAYGIIEIGLVCINTEKPMEKPASVGRVLPGYQVHVKNETAYGSCNGMACGELFFTGPGFFDAYFHPWTDEKAALADGWFETGDIGGMDEEGFLYLFGRKNHIINTAGIKVFPEEIEGVLNSHPLVRESFVYGEKHGRFGQIVSAKVVLRHAGRRIDESALKAFCGKTLADYKVPEKVDFVERIEKTVSTGKIRRPH